MQPLQDPAADSLCRLPAHVIAERVRAGETTACAVVDAHLLRIAECNESYEALVALGADPARDAAQQIDDRRQAGETLGPLAGVPVAISDLVPTRRLRTTFGSRVYRNYVPRHDALLVERLRAADAVVLGKTATTELGIGEMSGFTHHPAPRNVLATEGVAGGSAGGAASAVASFMVPLADGVDIDGAPRIAATFQGLCCLRPTPGRIPRWPTDFAWDTLSAPALVARDVQDLELSLRALAGPDERAPLSLSFLEEPQGPPPLTAAWTTDFDRCIVAGEVADLCADALGRLRDGGVRLVAATPDLQQVDEVFHVLRAWRFALRYQSDLHRHRSDLSAVIRETIEEGLKLNGLVIARAQTLRTRIYQALRQHLRQHRFVLAPATQVLPYPREMAGKQSYETSTSAFFGGMPLCYPATLAGLPALTVPFSSPGKPLPTALQILGRPGRDLELLAFGRTVQAALSRSVGADGAATT